MTDSQSQQSITTPQSEEELADFIYEVQNHHDAQEKAKLLWPLLRSLPAASTGEPVAWSYIIATARTNSGQYALWQRRVSIDKPDVPDGSIKELMPLYAAPASGDVRAAVIEPADGHGYTGEFTATEFNERAWDHEKAAKNGLSAGPNVSYVRTFQACAVALRYAAEHMFSQAPDPSTARIALLEAALNSIRSNANCHTKDLALATMPLIFQTATRAIRGDSI